MTSHQEYRHPPPRSRRRCPPQLPPPPSPMPELIWIIGMAVSKLIKRIVNDLGILLPVRAGGLLLAHALRPSLLLPTLDSLLHIVHDRLYNVLQN